MYRKIPVAKLHRLNSDLDLGQTQFANTSGVLDLAQPVPSNQCSCPKCANSMANQAHPKCLQLMSSTAAWCLTQV